jgi:hypothetical protein
MKYVVQWTTRPGGSGAQAEEDAKRLLQLFSKWSPAPDATFHQFVERLSGDGGYAVVETDNPQSVMEGPSKFGAHLAFTVEPVIDIMESVQVGQEGIDFRESIS